MFILTVESISNQLGDIQTVLTVIAVAVVLGALKVLGD